MKKIFLTGAIICSGYCTYSQNTYPWLSSGNVGIGTTNPNAKLHLVEDGSTGAAALNLTNRNSNQTWGMAVDVDAVDDKKLMIFDVTAAIARLTINTLGQVGIGTTSPSTTLHVNGITSVRTNTTTDGYLSINPGSATCQGYINWWKPGGTRVGYMGYTDGSTTNNLALTLEASANFIVNGGNVLIGKISEQPGADYKLDIGGSARADKIVVNTTGADFVFDKKYTLPKLSEVKSYIEQNHHLPEITSAKEMQTNGMSVGEINTKLLQKVEELTLYAIEQQKQIEQLKEKDTQLKSQQQQIDELKSQLAKLIKQQ